MSRNLFTADFCGSLFVNLRFYSAICGSLFLNLQTDSTNQDPGVPALAVT